MQSYPLKSWTFWISQMKTLLEIIITIVGYLLLSDCKIIVDYNKVYSKCIPSSNYAPYQESFDCSW